MRCRRLHPLRVRWTCRRSVPAMFIIPVILRRQNRFFEPENTLCLRLRYSSIIVACHRPRSCLLWINRERERSTFPVSEQKLLTNLEREKYIPSVKAEATHTARSPFGRLLTEMAELAGESPWERSTVPLLWHWEYTSLSHDRLRRSKDEGDSKLRW